MTAELFLKITQQLQEIPLSTLKQMQPLLFALPYETGNWVSEIYHQRKNQEETYYPHLHFKDGLAFQLSKELLPDKKKENRNLTYPVKKAGKLSFYPDNYRYRKVQGKMMNRIHRFFSEDSFKDFFLEAPFGIGKTFGYLYPLSFLLQGDKKAVIATSTLMLQNQLLAESLALAEKLPFDFSSVVLKSRRHYISLAAFKKSLQEKEISKKIALYKLMILNWLLVTKSGEFSELNLLSKDEDFFYQISAACLVKNSALYPYEYAYLKEKKAKNAQVIITNHAYLVENSQDQTTFFKEKDYLILDEAHQLAHTTRQKQNFAFHFFEAKKKISYYEEKKGQKTFQGLWLQVEPAYLLLQRYFSKNLQEDTFYFNRENFLKLPLEVKEAFDDLYLFQQQGLKELEKEEKIASPMQQIIKTSLKELKSFLTIDENHLSWLTVENNELIFHGALIANLDFSKEKWYQNFTKILYLGASFYYGKKNIYQKEVGLENSETLRLNSPYAYENQLKFYQVKKIKDATEEETLIAFLEKSLEHLQKPILVLFTSQEALKRVYFKIQSKALEVNREILAQDINGSKEKLLKRFRLSENGILLGNLSFWEGIDLPSFWEGIDLPEESLEVVILAKLPFENPQWPEVKAIYQKMEESGENPFEKRALPLCVLKLNQALGRLVRSEKDRGGALIFDERIKDGSYHEKIEKHLIPGVTVEEKEVWEAFESIKDFLQDTP